MKKILFSLIVLFALVSCEKDKNIDRFDPNAMITIRPAKDVNTRAMKSGLTDLEIVEQTVHLAFMSNYGLDYYMDFALTLERPFKGNHMKDFSIPALKMYATDIIGTDFNGNEGAFLRDFLYGYDFYFVNTHSDTIAYIPQSVIENARIPIRNAYDEQNYTEVYRLFNEAFTFMPMP